jgi:AraC family transcriptional regulator of adaptative response/methylated-DNA-[protein]-cysteine methyltransferase
MIAFGAVATFRVAQGHHGALQADLAKRGQSALPAARASAGIIETPGPHRAPPPPLPVVEVKDAPIGAAVPDTPRVAETPAPVGRARAYLDRHFDQTVTLGALGRAAGMSPHHLQRTFKKAYGVSPREYQQALRHARLKSSLRGAPSVTEAILDAGYSSPSRVYETSDARLGMPPGTYRRGGRGMRIRYGLTKTALGRLLVGATERGVCAVALGDDDRALEAGLRAEYPAAEIARGGADLDRWLAALAASLEGEGDLASVPLDVQGTAFQQRVWRALRAIPRGETRSYGDVAAAVGNPKASRAVAQACAGNRVALVVPCHRVVRGDGEAGGYRWGAERK